MTYEIISERTAEYKKITSPVDAVEALKRYSRKRKEHFILITLNGAHDINKIKIITIGLLNKTMVHPREVFRPAILDNAAGVIIAHNHPSGNVSPSSEDDNITKRLKEAGELIGIPVLDHIIISKDQHYSYLESTRYPF